MSAVPLERPRHFSSSLPAALSPTRLDARRRRFASSAPNDKICVQAFDDPRVPGVSCHISQAKTGGVKGRCGVAEDPSRFAIACARPAQSTLPGQSFREEKRVQRQATSLIFKNTKVIRMLRRQAQHARLRGNQPQGDRSVSPMNASPRRSRSPPPVEARRPDALAPYRSQRFDRLQHLRAQVRIRKAAVEALMFSAMWAAPRSPGNGAGQPARDTTNLRGYCAQFSQSNSRAKGGSGLPLTTRKRFPASNGRLITTGMAPLDGEGGDRRSARRSAKCT